MSTTPAPASDLTANPARDLRSLGHTLPPDAASFGWLRESTDAADDPDQLRQRFDRDGYLFLRDFLDPDDVLAARRSVMERLMDRGLLRPGTDPMEGVVNPETDAQDIPHADLAVRCPPVRHVVFGERLCDFYARFFDEPIRHFDNIWLRAIAPGHGTACHCDWVYMSRGSRQLMTCWIPYGDIPLSVGGLLVLEDSFRRKDKLAGYLERDVDDYCQNKPGHLERLKKHEQGWSFPGHLSRRPDLLPKQFGTRWLTAECFRPGDILTFRMDLVHGSLDNRSDRFRLSSDTRYQPASHPADRRWIGANPVGHGPDAKRGMIC
ncbi:MAG: phytanoyl-CoA dioxygenase family protein [Planctomycetota bacterium]